MDNKDNYMTEKEIPHYVCDYCAYPIYNNIDELWHSKECKGHKDKINGHT